MGADGRAGALGIGAAAVTTSGLAAAAAGLALLALTGLAPHTLYAYGVWYRTPCTRTGSGTAHPVRVRGLAPRTPYAYGVWHRAPRTRTDFSRQPRSPRT
ncbi:hypothetical protein [Streptomyces sp. ISL-94]|uniref:hypothetical protein n=1 Tax=Streptomyces sp. ISL-94 TaxID=2819190 RepID=UPI001BE89D6B|nr:hypothetical protein [Streptomyces sp. ISL-94]MBT2482289.1 hypothetical protein [Streptomyces sp. ISL-94]